MANIIINSLSSTQIKTILYHYRISFQSVNTDLLTTLTRSYRLQQWFSTFLVERNPNETFQRLEEPLCNNLISYANHLINKMRLKYSCLDLFTIKIQTVKNYIYSCKKFNVNLEPDFSCTTLQDWVVFLTDTHEVHLPQTTIVHASCA